jgi:hypothetical protein
MTAVRREAMSPKDELSDQALPEYLEGLELPTTKDEAITYAAEHGAPNEVLEFMEHLPAAIFTSERGLRHAFANIDVVSLTEIETFEAEDGEADDGISS